MISEQIKIILLKFSRNLKIFLDTFMACVSFNKLYCIRFKMFITKYVKKKTKVNYLKVEYNFK